MRRRKLLVRVFILTSIFWLSVDFLFFLTFLNNQLDFFSSETIIPRGVSRTQNGSNTTSSPGLQRSTVPRQFNVIKGLGEGGSPAKLPSHLKLEAEKVFNNHSFDVILSDRISLDRTLKDVRGPK